MENLIKDNEELMKYLNNCLSTVQGEKTLFEKMRYYIALSQTWVHMNVIDINIDIAKEVEEKIKAVIAYDAFHRAIPSLDLVLTPNGFGVVSNQNIAPASRERVDGLRFALITERDALIAQIWHYCRGNDEFCDSQVGKHLSSSVLQNIQDTTYFDHNISFDGFREMRSIARSCELHLRDKVVSPILMARLRSGLIRKNLNESEAVLADLIITYLIDYVRAKKMDLEFKHDTERIVNTIREDPELYDTWRLTHTAKAYEDYSFCNDKNKGGVWL